MKWRGVQYLWDNEPKESIFIPEDHNEDQGMIIDMVRDFVDQNRSRSHVLAMQRPLMEAAAELGLLGAHISEEFGGLELDTHTNTFIADYLGTMSGSFDTTFAAHIGIGVLPIYYYGNAEQKAKYIPPSTTAEHIHSYCLTEPTSGSDAMAMKTEAKLSDDGKHYLINGQKMWITNAGFADVLVVFAKVDGDKVTAFIVDAKSDGIALGEEEKKMGIKGSSTRQIFFENVKVPVENVLGEVGKGYKVAFNVLNIGRFKLGAMSLGACKIIIDLAAGYANERIQFKYPISRYGAIREKLAKMTIRAFEGESTVYRVSDWMEDRKQAYKAEGKSIEKAGLYAAMEYALECAVIKIAGSESIDYCTDENIQIHGGIGFSEEMPYARMYRDARINRIYEGTNEINRLVIIKQLLKDAEKGENPLVIHSLGWLQGREVEVKGESKEERTVYSMKDALQYVLAILIEAQMSGRMDLRKDQYVAMALADMAIHILQAESAMLRVKRLEPRVLYDSELLGSTLAASVYYNSEDFVSLSKRILVHVAKDEEHRATLLKMFRKIFQPLEIDIYKALETVASFVVEKNGYPFRK